MQHTFTIVQAESKDVLSIQQLAITTFIESHGHSAPEEDIQAYISDKFGETALLAELRDTNNQFYLIYAKEKLVGYSKVIPNYAYPSFIGNTHLKMERLYVLQETHGSGIGQFLFNFNVELARKLKQSSIWLYTWVENKRAIRFYEKQGFIIVDSADFHISKTHINPNHIMQMALH